MHTQLAIVGMITVTLVAFALIYIAIHYGPLKMVNFGRIGALVTLGGATMLDQLNALPWGTILSDAEAKMVGFSIAIGMAILHVLSTVKTDTSAPNVAAAPAAPADATPALIPVVLEPAPAQ